LAFAVSYFAKPFGAICFGYFIDRFGRKKILLSTTLLMTIATSAIGLLPSNIMGLYALFAFRIIQGLSISGEFSSAIIIAVKQGRNNPAFSGSLVFVGGTVGLLLANLSAFILLCLIPHEQIINYAWRIPFLIGAFGCLILFL
jgi:MHS family proline/betaine transporter-like MFS transporter